MIKQISKTLVFFFLLLSSSLPAVPPVVEPSNSASAPAGEQLCNLPPPSYFAMTSAGPTWVTLTWNSVPSAVAYHIITREVATGNIVDNSTVPANFTTLTINNLTPSTSYESRIWSVCANGQDGPTYTITFPETVILDLVVSGYQAPAGCLQEACKLEKINQVCSFSWTSTATTYFKVRRKTGGGPEHYFMLKTPGNILDVYPEINPNSPFTFEEENNAGQFILIKCMGGPVARFSTVHLSLSQEGELFREGANENNLDFVICKLETCNQGRPAGSVPWQDSHKLKTAAAAFVVASPNPFTDQLTVQINPLVSDASEQVTLRLYDMQGFEVFASQTPGGPQIHKIPAANLLPGVYFLRVETATQVQTIKVVKAQ